MTPPRLPSPPADRAVGVIGHVDHGKTTLVRLLTGTDTDRLPEEKRRGISIALGFAHLPAADGGAVDLIDMPGHERFVRTAVAGLSGVETILLVVAADAGVQPQTVEHVAVAALLGIDRAVLAITGADRAPEPVAAATEAAAIALLGRAGIALVAAHRTAAPDRAGIGALADTLAALPARAAGTDGWAFLPVDRAFSVAGAGTVVTGTLRRGSVAAGDALDCWPAATGTGHGGSATPLPVRVRAIERRGVRITRAEPGGRTALNLRGSVEAGRLGRGTVLATPDALRPATVLAVDLSTVAGAPPLRDHAGLLLLVGTDEVAVRLRLLDAAATLDGGARGFAELVATRPVLVPVRERFVLRIPSPARTVAGGVVLAHGAARRRRAHAPTIDALDRRRDADDAALVRCALAEAGANGAALAALGHAAGVSAARAAALLAEQGDARLTRRGQIAIGASGWNALLRRLPDAIRAGTPRPTGIAPALLDEAVAELTARGVLGRRDNRLAVPDRARDAAADNHATLAAARLLARCRDGGLAPPLLAELASDDTDRRVLDRLFRTGALVRTTDRVQKRDWAFHPDAIARARALLGPALRAAAPDGLPVGAIGALLGITRRHAVPLLEHLDRSGVTRRVGDRRVAAPPPSTPSASTPEPRDA